MKISQECFYDSAIQDYIESNGEKGKCDITGSYSEKVVELSDLSDLFSALDDCVEVSQDKGVPLWELLQEDWNIFSNANDGKRILASILQEVKSSLSIDSRVVYSVDVGTMSKKWNDLKRTMIDRFRYMSILSIHDEDGFLSAFEVHGITLPKDTILFRSRVVSVKGKGSYPPEEMGAPKPHQATAGRANSEGIPVLYLADKPSTTFYESRAIFLDDISTATFRAVSDLRIIDFSSNGSPFNPIYESLKVGLGCEKAIRIISEDLSKPMRRTDSDVEYVPTQFLCEYIRAQMQADGISFNSSLCDGVNYVIFDEGKFKCEQVNLHHIKQFVISE